MFVEEVEIRKAILLTPLRHGMVLRRCLLHVVFLKLIRARKIGFDKVGLMGKDHIACLVRRCRFGPCVRMSPIGERCLSYDASSHVVQTMNVTTSDKIR